MDLLNSSALLATVGILVMLTNVVTQVLKKLTWDKLPTNILAIIISIVLTLVAFFAWCQITCLVVTWYMVAAAVVGFMVAYAAMFGFDKLKEALKQIKEKKRKNCRWMIPRAVLCYGMKLFF